MVIFENITFHVKSAVATFWAALIHNLGYPWYILHGKIYANWRN